MRSPPTARSESGTTLLVLAHQDDEIAFAPLIIRLTDEGRMVNLVYLTDGGGRGVRAARRDAESRNALATLGVAPKSVWFLGSDAGIADGALYRSMEMAYMDLRTRFSDPSGIAAIYTLANEGGHADHDAAHAIAAMLARSLGCLDRAFQVPFYRAVGSISPWFVLFSPLAENGPVFEDRVNLRLSLPRVKLVCQYPSQWRSMLGLGPVLLWHAIAQTPFRAQPIDMRRLGNRPMPGPLLYEHRGGPPFAAVSRAVHEFITVCEGH